MTRALALVVVGLLVGLFLIGLLMFIWASLPSGSFSIT